MKIIYAGTPEFAVPALQALIDAGHQIVMVLTQPDRPAGRGMQLKASPVKQLALQHDLKVFQPESLKPTEVQAEIEATQADVMIVAAYGLIIPTAVLHMPKYGCYNIHASLLPRWRGAAPIHRAILAGDHETGVTIMEVVPALDAGAMVSTYTTVITEADTTQTLHEKLSVAGATLMVDAMRQLEQTGTLHATPQDESLVTYAHKLDKSECALDWQKSASQLSQQIRAFNPFPVARTQFKDQTCRIWFAQEATEYASNKNYAGVVLSTQPALVVACGEGAINIHTLQMPGGKRQSAAEFVHGQHVQVGDVFS